MTRWIVALALLLTPSLAAAQPTTTPVWITSTPGSASTTAPITTPCDLLSGGCLSAWSAVQRMSGAYTGSLFQVYRDDAQSFQIGTTSSGMVNLNVLHADCDGHDCYVQTLYDQLGLCNPTGTVGNQPLLGYDTNGLPMIVLTRGVTGLVNTGGVLTCTNTGSYPTTGSRTMYIATNNYAWQMVSELFGYSGSVTNNDGSGFVATVTQGGDANTPSQAVFGDSLEQFYYATGAYSPGYAQLVGMIKYNQTSANMIASVLTSSCAPSITTTCSAYTTFNGTPPHFSPYNTGDGNPNILRMGQGTDSFPYGGRFQSAALTNYATSTAEDSASMNALGATHFPQKPTPCSAAATPGTQFTATKPSSIWNETPSAYNGALLPNLSNLVFMVATRLMNSNYNGPLFRVQRQDNSATYDIYAAGCEADLNLLTQDCTGTTCNVTRWFDQSGHNWSFAPLTTLTTPTISISGMNSKPCVNFTATNPLTNTFTAALGATATGNSSGTTALTLTSITGTIYPGSAAAATITGTGVPANTYIVSGSAGSYVTNNPTTLTNVSITVDSNVLNVTAVATGTLAVGQVLQTQGTIGVFPTITAELTGTGSTGTYQISVTAKVVSSSWASIGAPMMIQDPSVWTQPGAGGSGYGLYQNQTIEAIWQSTGSGTFFGPLVSMVPAWELNINQQPKLVYAHNGGNDLVAGSSVSANQAHFSYLTADNSSPQNLTSSSDNQVSPDTGTSSATGLGAAGLFYSLGATSYGNQSTTACEAMIAVYNDIESGTNLTNAYKLAHNVYATP